MGKTQVKIITQRGKNTRKGKKNRKHGRDLVKCERYRAAGRREANKQKRADKRAKKRT